MLALIVRPANEAELSAAATPHVVAALGLLDAVPALRARRHALLLHVAAERRSGHRRRRAPRSAPEPGGSGLAESGRT